MNRYHKYINLPFEITKPEEFNIEHDTVLHESISGDHPITKNISKFFDSLGLYLIHSEYFYTPADGGKLLIHTDNRYFDDQVKINVTWGPEEGVTRWWKTENPKELVMTPDDSPTDLIHKIYTADEEDCEMVYEANTNRPSLVSVGQLHSTYNPGNKGRYTMCFVPAYKSNDKHVQWDEAMKIFNNYLDD